MKVSLQLFRGSSRRHGWALLAVLALSAVGIMVLAGVMNWANENATVAGRNNEYFATSYAAEAATEKVLANMCEQYEDFGFATVSSNMSAYRTTLPTASDNAYWSSYQFSGGRTANQLVVTNTAQSTTVVLGPPYAGLNMLANTYEIIANAQNTTTEFKIVSTVGQQLNLGTIPLFQFAIFYQGNMEIAPGAAMTITGPVHGNTNIYLEAGAALTLNASVTAAGVITNAHNPLDNDHNSSTIVAPTFSPGAFELSGQAPLNLPVGTNATGVGTNDSQDVYAILLPPTNGQTYTSATGTNLLYNQADMIIIISNNNNNIYVTSGTYVNNQATVISNGQYASWLSTNGSFVDQRDNSMTVQPVTINVGNLVTWSATNTTLSSALSSTPGRSSLANVQSIYVDDQRSTNITTVTSSTNHGVVTYTTNTTEVQPGIVLTNGAVLPPQGLSIATPDPVYIEGNWNIRTTNGGPSDAGTNMTADSLPSAIFADAITILSPAWNPDNSAAALSSRIATADTVNAAFLTGNVPDNGSTTDTGLGYSGGVENFPRFLENWSSVNFYYNGSMVCMFPSQIANYVWPGTGTVYNPPNRYWAYDTNFNNPNRQPPMMPHVITIQRSKWALLAPYTTSF
ncbi:MAG: hypothetical protein ACLQU4_04235 [Limisphaerales bacterium]